MNCIIEKSLSLSEIFSRLTSGQVGLAIERSLIYGEK